MRLLLDTHVWVWSTSEPTRLSRAARAALTSPANELFVSTISTWEIGLLWSRGRLSLGTDARQWVAAALGTAPVSTAELTHEVALTAASLPDLVGRDPADRFLVASCLVHDLTLVTADAKLRAWSGVRTFW